MFEDIVDGNGKMKKPNDLGVRMISIGGLQCGFSIFHRLSIIKK
jgi:hypothetical protein